MKIVVCDTRLRGEYPPKEWPLIDRERVQTSFNHFFQRGQARGAGTHNQYGWNRHLHTSSSGLTSIDWDLIIRAAIEGSACAPRPQASSAILTDSQANRKSFRRTCRCGQEFACDLAGYRILACPFSGPGDPAQTFLFLRGNWRFDRKAHMA